MRVFIEFRRYLFLQMASFWTFLVYKFQPPKKDSWIKGYLANVAVKINGKTGRAQEKNWFFIDLLLTDSKNLAELISFNLYNFFPFIYFRELWILCILSVYLFSRMLLKRKFCVYLILWNQPKFVQKINTQKLVHLR